MWIQRTPDEVAKWNAAAEREAFNHARLLTGIIWILVCVIFAGGSSFLLASGTIIPVQMNSSAISWLEWPSIVLITAPFAYWLFRREKRSELKKIQQRTICAQCDTADSGNAGVSCQCGGSFVLSSTMKWVEERRTKGSAGTMLPS